MATQQQPQTQAVAQKQARPVDMLKTMLIEFAKDASTTNEAIRGWYKKTSTNPVAGKTYKQ